MKQHIKNWHTLEKSEQRELKLLRKLEKYKKFAENYKKLREQVRSCDRLDLQNKMLSDEVRKLKQTLETHQEVPQPVTQSDDALRRPVPPFTQFLREQYESFRSKGVFHTLIC